VVDSVIHFDSIILHHHLPKDQQSYLIGIDRNGQSQPSRNQGSFLSFQMANLTALDISQRPPRVRWTDDMRRVLCCLMKYYVRDRNAFLNIFYSLFQQELIESGFKDGKVVGWSRLESQWVDMKKHGNHIWGDVHCSGFDRESWLPVLDKIEGTADALGLTMAEKEHDTIDSSRFVYQDRARQYSSQLVSGKQSSLGYS
jgi:hypothetical protein